MKLETQRKTSNIEYSGKHSNYQLSGNNLNGKQYGLDNQLNNYQIFLYNRALFGLSVYSHEEILEMHWEKRKRIIKVHKRAKELINVWKQKVVNRWSTAFFQAIFPKTEFTAYLVKTAADTDKNFSPKISFKDLGITKKQIIEKLIQEGILPANFYQLNLETKCK